MNILILINQGGIGHYEPPIDPSTLLGYIPPIEFYHYYISPLFILWIIFLIFLAFYNEHHKPLTVGG